MEVLVGTGVIESVEGVEERECGWRLTYFKVEA